MFGNLDRMNHLADVHILINQFHHLIVEVMNDFDIGVQSIQSCLPLINQASTITEDIFRIQGPHFFQLFCPIQGKAGWLPGITNIGKGADYQVADKGTLDLRNPHPANIIRLRPGCMQLKGLVTQLERVIFQNFPGG